MKRTHLTLSRSPKPRARGFALIEALVALLVVAFGMMAIGAFQYTLSRSADIAKQRSEATRIAQREIDRLRSFGQRGADANAADDRLTYAQDLQVGPVDLTDVSALTNTTYRTTSTISAPPGPVPADGERYRWVNVVVRWDDRTGVEQRVMLSTAISDGAPGDLGGLSRGGGVATTLRPKNRNINIPYPAVNLAGGASSAFVPPPGTAIFTFNNETGNVTQVCRAEAYAITEISRIGTTATALSANHPFTAGMRVRISGASPADYNGEVTVTSAVLDVSFTYAVADGLATPATLTAASATRVVTLTEGMDLANLAGVDCDDFTVQAYVLSGYIRFKTNGNNQVVTRLDIANPLGFTDPTRALIATDVTQAPSATTSPLLITSTDTGHAPAAYECYAQRQLTVRLIGNNAQGQTDLRSIPDEGTNTVVPPGFTDQNAPRHIAYMCIVTPANHDNDAQTPPTWSGLVTLNPRGGWVFDTTGANRTLGQPTNDSIGAATGKARLCRFTSDYNYDGDISNGEHPRYYRQVTGALDNQNYLVVDGEDECPGDDKISPTVANPTADDFTDTNSVEHQPTAEFSYRCDTITGNNTVRCNVADRTWLREAALPSAIPLSKIPME